MGERVTDIDFDILREPWNKYELGDGSIVKTRCILTKIHKRVKIGETTAGYGLDSQNVIVIYNVPPNLKGEPSKHAYGPKELETSIVQDDIRYTTISEEWNEYVAEDGTRIRLKSTVTKVSRTSKYDKNGNPRYLVQTSVLPQVKPLKK
jgi:hypothetical protein